MQWGTCSAHRSQPSNDALFSEVLQEHVSCVEFFSSLAEPGPQENVMTLKKQLGASYIVIAEAKILNTIRSEKLSVPSKKSAVVAEFERVRQHSQSFHTKIRAAMHETVVREADVLLTTA